MTLATATENKEIYTQHHDKILEKRFLSSSSIRRHAHHTQYNAFVEYIPAGSTVLDSGCGEGVLSVLLAQKGCIVTGIDLSEPNIVAAKKYAASLGIADKIQFLEGDAEHLPVADASFDYVISSHVLEHIPDFVKGVTELKRVAKKEVLVAIPTCVNLCSFVQLGGDKYWTFSRRTPYAIFLGALRVLWAYISRADGVNESYAGRPDLIHIFRFPRIGIQLLEQGGLKVRKYRASSFTIPYFPIFLPLTRVLEKFVWSPVLRNFGYGTTYVCTLK